MLYWAPEVLRDYATNSAKADIYSYGILIAEIVERQVPYSKERLTTDVDSKQSWKMRIPTGSLFAAGNP